MLGRIWDALDMLMDDGGMTIYVLYFSFMAQAVTIHSIIQKGLGGN
jgi:hypothetical protein